MEQEWYTQLPEVLQAAASQDPTILKAAEGKLESWENKPGFYAALTKFATQLEFNTNTRFIAVVHLKNGTDKYWRRGPGARSIGDEEKIEIRAGLKQLMMVEPVAQIATQLAVTIAKIARLDVPNSWPDLIPLLMENVRSTEPDRQCKALLCTHHVLKVLSTKRLTGDRKMFHEISSEIFEYLLNLWDSLYGSWQNSDHRAHYALKILRILCIRGHKDPGQNPNVKRFMDSLFTRAKGALQSGPMTPFLEKHVNTMWKVIEDFLETHPLDFVTFLRSGLEFAAYSAFTDEGRSVAFERVLIHGLNLMKGVVLCPEYIVRDLTPASMQKTDPRTIEAIETKRVFFTDTTLEAILRILITKYLPLTPTELERWAEDPEEFALRMEDVGDGWRYSLRQSSEALVVTMFKEFKKSVEIILKLMKEFEAPLQDPNDHALILTKDALYCAVGMTAGELYDEFFFDGWLQSTLLAEASLPVPILQRRIVWLVGQWTGVKIQDESRPIVYSVLVSGLKSTDIVIRIMASESLRNCLDDFDFTPEQFMPFLPDTFTHLFGLLKEARECDVKMRVMHTMCFLIERIGPQIKTTIPLGSLTQYLPILWNTDHEYLKDSVISTANALVGALGSEAAPLTGFLQPVIQIATDLTKKEHVYLLEDALKLWQGLMEYAADPPDPALSSLASSIIPLLSTSTEHLKPVVGLVNLYCIVYPETFIQQYGFVIMKELASATTDMRAEGVSVVMRAVENILRTSPINGPEAVKPILKHVFLSVYEKMDTEFLMSMYLAIIARLLVISEPVFRYGLDLVAQSEGVNQAKVLETLMTAMMNRHIDTHAERQKIIAIALLKLMSTADQIVIHNVCGIFLCVTETLNDITKTDLSGKTIDSLYLIDPESICRPDEDGDTITPKDVRKKILAARDVVFSLDLIQLFRNEVSNLCIKLGDVAFKDVMSTIDVETMQGAKAFLE